MLGNIRQLCIESKECDPAKLFIEMLKNIQCEHSDKQYHCLAGLCFITAVCNTDGSFDKQSAVDEVLEKTGAIPDKACTLWGVCGCAVALSAAVTVAVKHFEAAAQNAEKVSAQYLSLAMKDISQQAGDGCCKQKAFLALKTAVSFMSEKYGVAFPGSFVRCSFSLSQANCCKDECPFYSKYFEISANLQNYTQRRNSMNSYGLVLAGGGGKGAYQIGAWKALREMGVTFDAIAGVSIGSINGALIAAGDYDKADLMWHSVSIDKGVKITEALPDAENLFSRKNWGTLFKEFIKKGGIDASPAESFVSQFIDEKKVRESGIPLGMITVQMTQGVTPLEIFIDDIPEGLLTDYLLASSNIPLAMGIGPEGEKFLDGGVYDNTPVTTLKKRGYNRLIVVDISNIKGVAHNLDFLNSEVVYIRPYDIDSLGAAFDFDMQTIDRRVILGYLDAKKAFSQLLGKIYYFLPEVFREIAKDIGPDLLQKAEEFAWELGVEQIEIYTHQSFFSALKNAYEAEKLQREEKEAEDSAEQDVSKFSKLKKRFSQKKSFEDYTDVIAYLESGIF